MTSTPIPPSPTAPDADVLAVRRVPWSQLGPEFIAKWGYARGKPMPEHVEVMGQTGSGKSRFVVTILLQRQRARGSHIVVIATKGADETLSETGWPIITVWPPDDPRQTAHIYWIPSTGLDEAGQIEQARQIYALLTQLWKPGANIIVVYDEVAYLVDDLNFPRQGAPLRTTIAKYYREGRSLGITEVASTQRPQGVIRQVHSESQWVVGFAPTDEEDGERMAQVFGSRKKYLPILQSLDRENFEFLILHRITGKLYISWLDVPIPAPPTPREQAKHLNAH